MEPGETRETREPREPGPGAETAAAPRWEEAKTFHDNLAPKKKPKSVKAGHGAQLQAAAQPLPLRAAWGERTAFVGKAGQRRLRKRPGLR
ncbi:hypothetical protein J1605_012316 [Eschrichtius robustus]|uniref:Uncharacterized protein n=1 Tax=Eschrichtius robustus TaxID=9764 RepID=A0AB34GGP5_ESCRO|nr:hypothetical protein J1605_012316 [Eschrichtius robustus]